MTFNILQHGDVVMFRQHGDLKFSRIVGMAGESVEVKQGQLYRDDRQIKAPYAKNIKQTFSYAIYLIQKEISFHLISTLYYLMIVD